MLLTNVTSPLPISISVFLSKFATGAACKNTFASQSKLR
jgi:hypothetical protein